MTVPQRLALLDTSFVLALENRDDPLHERAKSLANDFSRENRVLLLHWGILLEIGDGYARVERREKGCALLDKLRREEGFRIVPLTETLLQDAIALYGERSDKNWGLTDCVSFALMRQEGIVEALTADVHFRRAGLRALLLD
jgi:predicted nucleic acid-binding protein